MTTARMALLSCIAIAALATTAWSLDAKDMVLMVQHGVEEQVIVNMICGNRLPAPLAAADILLLNSCGASTRLMEFLTSPEAVSVIAGGIAVYDPPATIIESPTTIIESPTYIYTERYYYNDCRYNYGYTYPWYGRCWSRPPPRPRPPPPPGRSSGFRSGGGRPSVRSGVRPNDGERPPRALRDGGGR